MIYSNYRMKLLRHSISQVGTIYKEYCSPSVGFRYISIMSCTIYVFVKMPFPSVKRRLQYIRKIDPVPLLLNFTFSFFFSPPIIPRFFFEKWKRERTFLSLLLRSRAVISVPFFLQSPHVSLVCLFFASKCKNWLHVFLLRLCFFCDTSCASFLMALLSEGIKVMVLAFSQTRWWLFIVSDLTLIFSTGFY